MLENCANTSFVNRITDTTMLLDKLVADPLNALRCRGPL
jgi:delta 1-pyrroline-5-carboxylate dehydrogenase